MAQTNGSNFDLPSPRSTQLSDILERDRAASQPRRFAPLRRNSQHSYQEKAVRAGQDSVETQSSTTTVAGMEADDFFAQMRDVEEENSDEDSEEDVEQLPVRQTLQ